MVGKFPLRVQQGAFLPVKAVDVLRQTGGGGFIGGEHDGAPSQRVGQGGDKVRLVNGGQAVEEQGAFARAQRVAREAEGGEILQRLKHGGTSGE